MKRRKLWLVLPLLVIPFLTLAFWALGGGKKKNNTAVAPEGLNLALPDAQLKEDRLLDKLSFYDKADQDSLKMDEWMRSDPYFKRDTGTPVLFPTELQELTSVSAGKYAQRLNSTPFENPGTTASDQILQKLKQLEQEINSTSTNQYEDPVALYNRTDPFAAEAFQPDPLIPPANTGQAIDPDMKQLEHTLDKILDIQHPQRVRERSMQHKESAFAVSRTSGTDTLVKGFYSFSDAIEWQGTYQNTIEAMVAHHQTIVNGAVVKFRLLNDMYIQGKLVPKDLLISGVAVLEGERLQVEIRSIRSGKSIYPVELEVYDMDGLPGIYIPGTINREVAKESLNNSLSLADMTALDPSLKAQATATGISAVKSLISKKAKLVRVQLKAGYHVLLHNKNKDL